MAQRAFASAGPERWFPPPPPARDRVLANSTRSHDTCSTGCSQTQHAQMTLAQLDWPAPSSPLLPGSRRGAARFHHVSRDCLGGKRAGDKNAFACFCFPLLGVGFGLARTKHDSCSCFSIKCSVSRCIDACPPQIEQIQQQLLFCYCCCCCCAAPWLQTNPIIARFLVAGDV